MRRKKRAGPRARHFGVLRPGRPEGERIAVFLDQATASAAFASAGPDDTVFELRRKDAEVISLLTRPPLEIARKDEPEARRMLLEYGRPVTAEET